MVQDQDPRRGSIAHDLRQPLNVIVLAVGNVRARLLPTMAESDAAYLESKLDRIEEQVARMNELVDNWRIAADPA